MITLFDTVIFVIIVNVCVLSYYRWKFAYWRRKRVPYIEPQFPFGTFQNPFSKKINNAIMFQKQYHHLKSFGHKYGGLYSFFMPTFLLIDTELIRNVMSQDFQYFTDRGLYQNEKDDPLSANLFNLEGQTWRNLRTKLTPTFTSGKIKAMFPTLVACAAPLFQAVTKISQKKEPIKVKDLAARFTTDVIGSCGFGLECNSFAEPVGDFRKYGRMLFTRRSRLRSFLYLVASSNPSVGKWLGITKTNDEAKHFFLNIVKETVEYRQRNNIVRNDFLQLLINLINENDTDAGLTVKQIAAQAFIFFLAGFETSSTTLTFCLYELSRHQDIQKKVHDEINVVLAKHGGNITYDAIMEMKYLSSVLDETLRKYPPLASLQRVCVQNYKIPGTDTIIEKGTRIVIPVYALHYDSQYFDNPEEFDPGRFNDENKVNIPPFTYIPFGEGPRICIALRFGLLQTKVGLVVLLRNLKFTLNAKTQSPIEFDRSSFVLNAKGGVWLDIETVAKDAA